ncbi:MAG TPA: hypothetical protein PLM55_01010 [Chitinophagales bacterium]|nr:hypothetical protein [Chitinophagales bacterium]
MTTEPDTNYEVLEFLKKELKVSEHSNGVLSFYGIGARDLVKYLECPNKCGNWPFDFVLKVEDTLKKIKKKYIIPCQFIETQTEEDRVLSKLLIKNKYFCFGTNMFFKGDVNVTHVIQYMERQNAINDWSTFFLMKVQAETNRVKAFLL